MRSVATAFALVLLVASSASAENRPRCPQPPSTITSAFAQFDAATSPAPAGVPAEQALAAWLAYLSANVEFAVNADPVRIGRSAVADYFAPLLPVIGSSYHELTTITALCGTQNGWIVRGVLRLTRTDGVAITPIPFTDTLFIRNGLIERYEINLDPTPLGELFAP